MILVVGLGNPGPRYADTRHNVGFRLVDRLEAGRSAGFRERFNGLYTSIDVSGTVVGLLKPQTFMNDSGRSVQPAMQFFKLKLSDVLIAYDELDLPFGEVRLKEGGGDAGHRGVRSISQAVGSDTLRLRLGIGRPPPEFRGAVADFVLQAFAPAEQATLESMIERAEAAVMSVVTRGISAAMNAVNQRAKAR